MTQKLISSGQESVVEDDLGTKLGLLAHEIINETMNFRSAQIYTCLLDLQILGTPLTETSC